MNLSAVFIDQQEHRHRTMKPLLPACYMFSSETILVSSMTALASKFL